MKVGQGDVETVDQDVWPGAAWAAASGRVGLGVRIFEQGPEGSEEGPRNTQAGRTARTKGVEDQLVLWHLESGKRAEKEQASPRAGRFCRLLLAMMRIWAFALCVPGPVEDLGRGVA